MFIRFGNKMEENCHIIIGSERTDFIIKGGSKIVDRDNKLNKRFIKCYGSNLENVGQHDLSDGTRTFVPTINKNGVTEFIIIHGETKAEPIAAKIPDGNYRINIGHKEMSIKIKDGKPEKGRIEKPFFDYYCIILEDNPNCLVGYRLFL